METNQRAACPHCKGAIAVREEMFGQTVECPHCGKPVAFAQRRAVQPTMSARETYNVVTDLGTGVNVRLKDNLFQLAAIVVATVAGAVIGMLIADEAPVGAMTGGFIGLLVGLFGSGIFLMVYRFIQHARGHHE